MPATATVSTLTGSRRWSRRTSCNHGTTAGGRPPPAHPARKVVPMLLRHATLIRNVPGIERRGLLCRKSQGRLPVVWLHTPAKSFWATLHTIKRHGGRAEAVV